MNECPKDVVSATLGEADWNNSTVIGAYSPDDRSLKDGIGGDPHESGAVHPAYRPVDRR